jgi:hypothetical protein
VKYNTIKYKVHKARICDIRPGGYNKKCKTPGTIPPTPLIDSGELEIIEYQGVGFE